MSKRPEEYSLHYLNQQYSAMRWLAKQGLTPVQIREMRWGAVDETTRTIRVVSKVFYLYHNPKTGLLSRKEEEREIHIPVTGSGHEWYFLKSKYICPWMFTAKPPKTWRREGSREALFPLAEVERACRDLVLTESTSVLTFLENFDTIELSNLNITKMETKELIEKAKVVETGERD